MLETQGDVVPRGKGTRRGRKDGYKVGQALAATKKSMNEVNEVIKKMSDKQRRLFVALASGQDELKACIEAEDDSFRGIAKRVFTKEGKGISVSKITLDNVDDLDPLSYERLLNICKSRVKRYLGKYDLSNYLMDIQQLFKLVAPDAFKKMATLMNSASSEKIQAQMAVEILNRAGYQGTTRPDQAMPVQVNIVIPPSPTNAKDVKVYGEDGEELSGS